MHRQKLYIGTDGMPASALSENINAITRFGTLSGIFMRRDYFSTDTGVFTSRRYEALPH